MREIKFRAWDKALNANGGMIWNAAILTGKYFDVYEMETRDYPLMQYTGLKDKTGKEIYEGDIVFVDNGIGYIGKIIWANCAFMILPKGRGGTDIPIWRLKRYTIKIIGNIYENPELLT